MRVNDVAVFLPLAYIKVFIIARGSQGLIANSYAGVQPGFAAGSSSGSCMPRVQGCHPAVAFSPHFATQFYQVVLYALFSKKAAIRSTV